ncbi:PD40 domain-containing protein [Lewinella lacunae]|uniref:Tricorn protease homolog n=1 Tax=Neolewinella lacunae TaxID=1517758 RepID=A0A923PPL6_9BACT|nr:PD40 domain-containing protein [Neolewinella lacunae]
MSADHLAFTYAGDLWIANRDGSAPRRLTIDEGREGAPVFSPDGKTIAFTAQYDGNFDVYTVPAAGGIPQRLTWHPSDDVVRDFTPDGKNILFSSQREAFTNRFNHAFTIGLGGGAATPLDIPTINHAAYSADGKYLAYTPLGDRFSMWKNYRGGTISRIWVMNLADKSVVEIPKPTGGSNDTQPQWVNGKVYFRSDRNKEFNLFEYDPATKAVKQLTQFTDFPVISLSAGAGKIVFEQAGYLHELDPATGQHARINVDVQADILDVRPYWISGSENVRSAGASPSGKRLVFDFRGEVVTAPTENGDVMNLSNTPGVHETHPRWSPDGKTIAYFSDASGEYALHLYDNATKKARPVALNGTGFYAFPHWSPDSKRIAFVDNGRNLYVLDVASGKVSKVDQDTHYSPGDYRDLFGSWSADGNWLAYSKITETNFERAYVYNLSNGNTRAVSDPLANVTEPTFDPSGKYLYLAASTDAGPVLNWFQQSSNDMRATNGIYLVTLQKEVVNPLIHRNDLEEIKQEETKKDEAEAEKKEAVKAVRIDFDGLETRIVHLPIGQGDFSNLAAAKEGELLYLSRTDEGAKIHRYSLKDREDKELLSANWFEVTSNGEKLFVGTNNSWGVTDIGDPAAKDLKAQDAYGLKVKIDPVAEWKNIFYEMWRVNRDYFYDPGMHGVDWAAMKKKYEVFLPEVKTRPDLYRVMEWMGSELGVGHHRFGSRGTELNDPPTVGGGLLGADYETANGRYRIAKIYGGLNWNGDLRSPLTEPGVNVKTGEYLLAVDGEEVVATDNLYRFFEAKADRLVELKVGPNADGSGARTVMVTPISNEYGLRNRDWVEGNIKKVDEATNGQAAYVYVPNTGGGGFEYFKRYFFPQVNKKAIIVDERFNGGGQIADYYIQHLMRPYQNSWTYRYGKDQHAPLASIQGPKVLLVDETAGSGGDLFPYLWRKNELGPIIGKRTWGGLVGVLGYPEFIDGGSVTAPNVAFWDENGYRVENEGVAPDIEVEQNPADVMAGKDPQLERAIEEIMKALQANPVQTPKRPPFEKRGSAGY